ncbi:MAG: TrbC/VirB2 family protein [Candidatus Velthaea sp.]|jgi:type IV secretion system protein VirB2
MKTIKRISKTAAPFTALLVLLASPAFAATGGTALPWEGPLQTIQDSLTGPVATTIAVIALFAAGAGLVFGDEMSNFVKRVLIGVMSLALLIAGSHFVTALNITGFTV